MKEVWKDIDSNKKNNNVNFEHIISLNKDYHIDLELNKLLEKTSTTRAIARRIQAIGIRNGRHRNSMMI